jgi:hypothetical protein
MSCDEIGEGALLKADELAVGQELYPLHHIQTVADAHAARSDCLLDVVRLEVSALTSVVHLPQMHSRVAREDGTYHLIGQSYVAVLALFLQKVHAHCPCPLQLAYLLSFTPDFVPSAQLPQAEDETH